MADGLEILPVRGIDEITPGADLAAVIATAAPWLADGDVVVVTSKIVSKAEGQLVDMPPAGPEWEAAREVLVRAETARVVARRGATRIVQTHHGFVMAAAGIDASNVDSTQLARLPKDPDASARDLRAGLRRRTGRDVAVIISDTMGRPWRNGLTDVALGAAGIVAIRDHRGEFDRFGNEMQLTQMAVVDELASAADLVKGKLDGVPVAIVRGYLRSPTVDSDGVAPTIVRSADQDLFSLGTAEARAAGLRDAAQLTDTYGEGDVDLGVLARAFALAGPTTRFTLPDPVPDHGPLTVDVAPTMADPDSYVRLGMDVHRVRCALAAHGHTSAWDDGRLLVGRAG